MKKNNNRLIIIILVILLILELIWLFKMTTPNSPRPFSPPAQPGPRLPVPNVDRPGPASSPDRENNLPPNGTLY